MNRRFLLAPVLVTVVAAGAARMARAGGEAAVTIDDFAFTPAVLTVARGTAVTWTNRDDTPHVVADDAQPKETRSPALDTDDAYSRVFTTPGRYGYFCTVHPYMQGTVVVE